MLADVFFDVDGCLIDFQYKINLEESVIKRSIGKLIDKGFTFHLNSNRSIDSLSKIYERFGFNGVIITENGVSVYDPRENSTQGFGFDEIDREKLKKSLGNNTYFVKSDELIRNPENFKSYFDGERVYFCENTRKYTMTIYPRNIIGGKVSFDRDMLGDTLDKLSDFYDDYVFESSENYGNVLMIPKNAEKGNVLSSVARSGKIISFGDGVADISMFKKSSFFGAPKNACEEVKNEVLKKGGYLSNLEFTAGAHDFINKITEIENA